MYPGDSLGGFNITYPYLIRENCKGLPLCVYLFILGAHDAIVFE